MGDCDCNHEEKPYSTEYDAQQVIDNAYEEALQLLDLLLRFKESKEKKYSLDEIILAMKNLTYYLEDYAGWK